MAKTKVLLNRLSEAEAIRRLKTLFAEFPLEVDLFFILEKSKAWEKSEENNPDHNLNANLEKAFSSCNGNKKLLFGGVAPNVADQIIDSLNDLSIADFFRKNRARYSSVPIKKLYSPNLNIKTAADFKKKLAYYAIYCEVKILLSLIK